MTPKPPKQPPALIAEEIGMWGEVPADLPVHGPSLDPFYIKGYSDKRKEFEQAAARGDRPAPLPYRFQYVPTAKTSGIPDNQKTAEYTAKGYTPMLYDDAVKYGIDPKESGFVRAPDGTCRVANQLLMVAPRQVAARLAKQQQDLTKELSAGATSKLDAAVADFNARVGSQYGHASVDREETLHKG